MNRDDQGTLLTSPQSRHWGTALRWVGLGVLGAVLGSLGGSGLSGIFLFVLCTIFYGGYANLLGLVGGLIGGAIAGAIAGLLAGATGREGMGSWCGRLAGVSQWLVVGVIAVGGFLAGPLGSTIGITLRNR